MITRDLFELMLRVAEENPDKAFDILVNFVEEQREAGRKTGWIDMYALTNYPQASDEAVYPPAAEWLHRVRSG